MTGFILANLCAITPRLEGGWPLHLPPNLELYSHGWGYPAQPFGGGWAYYDLFYPDSVRMFACDGRDLPGWPRPALVSNNPYSLCLGDINGDDRLDVIYSGDWGNPTKIYARDASTGEVLPGWPVTLGKYLSTPCLWDMDGDGSPEVIAIEDSIVGEGPHRIKVHILDSDGSELPGWPLVLQGYSAWHPAVVGDPDGDGVGEVIFPASGLYMADAYGNIEPGWPFILGQDLPPHWREYLPYPPILVDLDRDGKGEIIFSTEIYDKDSSNDTMTVWVDTSRVFALKHDGSVVPGWPVILHEGRFPITPGDYDGDGLPELFLRYNGYTFLGPGGEIKFSFDRIPFGHITNPNWRGAADTDGDGRAELVFSGVQFIGDETSTLDTAALRPYTAGAVSVDCDGRERWRIKIGSLLPPESMSTPYSFCTGATPSFSDVDRDGYLELFHDLFALCGEGCGVYHHLWLYTWEIPGTTNWRIDWSGRSHDPWNTRNYDFWPDNPPLVFESAGKAGGAFVSVFPNPGKGAIAVNIDVQSRSPVILEAYDPCGRLVYSENLGILEPGSHRLRVGLKPGVYFLRARAEEGSGLIKAILAK